MRVQPYFPACAMFMVFPTTISSQIAPFPVPESEASPTRIRNSTHPLRKIATDEGPVDGYLPMSSLILVLTSDCQTERTRHTFLDNEQTEGASCHGPQGGLAMNVREVPSRFVSDLTAFARSPANLIACVFGVSAVFITKFGYADEKQLLITLNASLTCILLVLVNEAMKRAQLVDHLKEIASRVSTI